MMKFTMNAKKLKTMIEKGIAAINKKAPISTLTRLYFQVEENGAVKVLGTDLEHYAEIRTDNAYNTSPGVLGIEVDDIKVLTKMNGEITLEDATTETESKINIKCGKKTVSIPRYDNVDVFLPNMDETETKIMSVKENWLLDTIVNLAIYTSDNDNMQMMQVFNFNTKAKRVEALEGHRIGMRTLENQTMYETTENSCDTVQIHNRCIPVFKKIMDKKSENEIVIYQDKKYVKLEGKDFTYIIRRIYGEYYKVDQMLSISEDFKFIPDRKEILDAMKYNADLVKTAGCDKHPVVFHSENGKLYSYVNAVKYEAFDELSTSENSMKNMYIGFNPQFLADAFSVVDSDNPVCVGMNPKAPMLIYGNEYSFLVLPVVTTNDGCDYKEKFNENINRGKVA